MILEKVNQCQAARFVCRQWYALIPQWRFAHAILSSFAVAYEPCNECLRREEVCKEDYCGYYSCLYKRMSDSLPLSVQQSPPLLFHIRNLQRTMVIYREREGELFAAALEKDSTTAGQLFARIDVQKKTQDFVNIANRITEIIYLYLFSFIATAYGLSK
jgi:hypothetical protein